MFELAAIVIWFAFANWLAGGNMAWRKRLRLPGRSIYYAAAATAVVLSGLYGWAGFAVAVNFLWWRLPGWYGAIDAGTMPAATAGQARLLWFDMHTEPLMRVRDFIVMSARGVVAAPVFLWTAYNGAGWVPVAVLAAVSVWQGISYEAAHRAFARVDGDGKRVSDNAHAEILAGAGWGVAYYVVLSGWEIA